MPATLLFSLIIIIIIIILHLYRVVQYECTIDQEQELAERYCIDAKQTVFVHLPDGSTFLQGCHLKSVTSNRKSDSANRCVIAYLGLYLKKIPSISPI